MPLFAVPGWSMPADVKPINDVNPRKRKRPAGENSTTKVQSQSAEVNMEKLMGKLGNKDLSHKEKAKPLGTETGRRNGKVSHKKSIQKPAEMVSLAREAQKGPVQTSTSKPKRERSRKRAKGDTNGTASAPDTGGDTESVPKTEQKIRGEETIKRKKQKQHKPHDAEKPEKKTTSMQISGSDARLTNLQVKMKSSLEGARFRWINETLYKSNSKDAERLMIDDPHVFEEYHAGFRHQVTSWPSNPVDHFVETLSSYPRRSVIVDLGCGDATLAQKLVPKDYTVLSYDLISANTFIVATDICGKLPLPGAEGGDEGQVVDVVVCSLSLMSTNWLNCVREARRVLRKGGELKIAEVTSRFTNSDKFTSMICSVGFKFVSKDERNTHFTLFDFKKTDDSRILDDKVWQKILARGDVLQPCEYKRR